MVFYFAYVIRSKDEKRKEEKNGAGRCCCARSYVWLVGQRLIGAGCVLNSGRLHFEFKSHLALNTRACEAYSCNMSIYALFIRQPEKKKKNASCEFTRTELCFKKKKVFLFIVLWKKTIRHFLAKKKHHRLTSFICKFGRHIAWWNVTHTGMKSLGNDFGKKKLEGLSVSKRRLTPLQMLFTIDPIREKNVVLLDSSFWRSVQYKQRKKKFQISRSRAGPSLSHHWKCSLRGEGAKRKIRKITLLREALYVPYWPIQRIKFRARVSSALLNHFT